MHLGLRRSLSFHVNQITSAIWAGGSTWDGHLPSLGQDSTSSRKCWKVSFRTSPHQSRAIAPMSSILTAFYTTKTVVLELSIHVSSIFQAIFFTFLASSVGKEKVATEHCHIRTKDPMHCLLLSSLIRIVQNIILGRPTAKRTKPKSMYVTSMWNRSSVQVILQLHMSHLGTWKEVVFNLTGLEFSCGVVFRCILLPFW